MAYFFAGLSLGLLTARSAHKALLRFPLRCWFLGHVYMAGEPKPGAGKTCLRAHCGKWCDPYEYWSDRFENTFWTT